MNIGRLTRRPVSLPLAGLAVITAGALTAVAAPGSAQAASTATIDGSVHYQRIQASARRRRSGRLSRS